jgi:hypothetical protein
MPLRYNYPKGRVKAMGYFLDLSIVPNFEKRILDLWERSCRMYQLDYGYILVLKEQKYVDINNSEGSPLFYHQGFISNVELIEQIKNRLEVSKDTVLLMRHGALNTIALKSAPLFDPSIWVNLDGYKMLKLAALGKIAPPVIKVIKPNSDVRQIMNEGDFVKSQKLNQALIKLEKITQERMVMRTARGKKTDTQFSIFKALFTKYKQKYTAEGTYEQDYNPDENQLPRVGIFDRLHSLLAQWAIKSPLDKVIGKDQTKHIQGLINDIKRGDIDSALKDAIPLGNLRDALRSKGLTLGRIKGRLPDRIQPYGGTGSSSIYLDDQLVAVLRRTYEKAFEKIDRQGKYEKAAFILAELLRDIDRAVEYLEKHRQYKLAAQLAEGQQLPPDRVIRQWILAGDIDKALHVAVLSGCYEEAITALEISHPDAAKDLRWYCAQLHYRSGNIPRAADIAWPIVEKREAVLQWMKEMVQIGGAAGAQHLVRLAVNDQENFENYLIQIENLLNHGQFDAMLLFYDEVVRSGNSPVNARIASLCVRHYLTEVAKGKLPFDTKRWKRLCEIAGDLTLRADIRNLEISAIKFQAPLDELALPKEYHFGVTHGRYPVDAVVLHNGQILAAYGESGVELWHPSGKLSKQIAVPCHDIVLSDAGFSALLVAHRTGYQVIHKYDLKTKQAKQWLGIKVNAWAKTFDGNGWLIGRGKSLQLIDVNKKDQTVLWCVNDLPGVVRNIARTKDFFTAYLAESDQFQLWTYRLPNLYLKERTPYQQRALRNMLPLTFSDSGSVAGFNANEPNRFGIIMSNQQPIWYTPDVTGEIVRIVLVEHLLLAMSQESNGVCLHVFSRHGSTIKKRILSVGFQDADDITFRLIDRLLLVFNPMGHIIVIEMMYGRIITDLVV